jgi:polysaccharide biosynthesis/export protein
MRSTNRFKAISLTLLIPAILVITATAQTSSGTSGQCVTGLEPGCGQSSSSNAQCVTGSEPGCSQSPGANSQCVTGSEPACSRMINTPSVTPGSVSLPSVTGDSTNRQQFETPREEKPRKRPVAETTEFEQMVADSLGRKLPIFGMSLFDNSPTTFAPLSSVPVPANYVIGPGDEINVRVWGQVNINVRTTVDRTGTIYIPQVGNITVAGLPYSSLEQRLKSELGRIFRNFDVTASLGRLRSVQVFVVGEASIPGQFTVSSLSTLVNSVFASGGPTPHGSLRHIQLKRGSKVVTDLDLYALLIGGDKSKDAPIEPGDVIFYPPASGFVAVSGSVNVPAIYELGPDTRLETVLNEAGGTTVVADDQRVSIERIDASHSRSVIEVSFAESKNFKVQSGDIIRVLSMVPRFDNTVTLRGNVANPGRFRWTPNMRISDLIPNAASLLTREFWINQTLLTTGQATEYPVQKANNATAQTPENPTGTPDQAAPNGFRPGETEIERRNELQKQSKSAPNESTLPFDIRKSAPEINWDYALIQRLNPVDLSTKLIPFNLGKAIIDKEEASNIVLQSGDVVTIFSQRDVSVPQYRRTRFIKIEGEVHAPGIYDIGPSDNLQTLVARAGGLTPSAYLFGSLLTRVSVQKQQQKSLDDFVNLLSVQMQQTTAAQAAGNPDQAAGIQARGASQEQLLSSLRSLRAPGRVVLQFAPTDASLAQIPKLDLEDGDVFTIPHRPAVVSVVGAVYNQGSFLYSPKRKLSQYFDLAGRNTPIGDKGRMFVLRADGAVITKKGNSGMWRGDFSKYRMEPGDTLVVPSKLQIGAFQRNLRDWTQIFSQIAITAASLAVLAKQ